MCVAPAYQLTMLLLLMLFTLGAHCRAHQRPPSAPLPPGHYPLYERSTPAQLTSPVSVDNSSEPAECEWSEWHFTSANYIGIHCTSLLLREDEVVIVSDPEQTRVWSSGSDGEQSFTGKGDVHVYMWTARRLTPAATCRVRQLLDNSTTTTTSTGNGDEQWQPRPDAITAVEEEAQLADLLSVSCGRRRSDERIVGGQAAPAHQYPWLAGLSFSNNMRPFCAGSIINPRYIVTAAHCVSTLAAHQLAVLVGKHRFGHDVNQRRFSVSRIIVHAGFGSQLSNDIALLQLSGSLTSLFKQSGSGVAPVCWPRLPCHLQQEPQAPGCLAGRAAVVAGWGRLAAGAPNPPVVNHVTVPVWPHGTCRTRYGQVNIRITDTMLCAGTNQGGRDACQGDSGGPLMTSTWDGARYELVGIVSFGVGCGRQGFPGVYTRTTHFTSWVRRYTYVMY